MKWILFAWKNVLRNRRRSLLALLITAERFRAGVMIAIGHPLQSILQPRGTGPQSSSIAKPRPVSPGNSLGTRI